MLQCLGHVLGAQCILISFCLHPGSFKLAQVLAGAYCLPWSSPLATLVLHKLVLNSIIHPNLTDSFFTFTKNGGAANLIAFFSA